MTHSIDIEINGEVRGLHEWVKHFDVTYVAAYRRYKRGKVGADIFNIKEMTGAQKQAHKQKIKPQSFTEMAQLNLHMPKHAIDQLERIALLKKTTRNKLAVSIIGKYLYAPTPTQELRQEPIPVSKDPEVNKRMQQILDDFD